MPTRLSALEPICEDDCLDLLRSNDIGRVVLSIGALPVAFPVNYWVIGRDIVFRSAPGAKLSAATDQTVVGFEVDELDRTNRTGWSVSVVGLSRLVVDVDEIAGLDRLDLRSWLDERTMTNYVKISIEQVSGRRINPG